jgi:hypothetical protein
MLTFIGGVLIGFMLHLHFLPNVEVVQDSTKVAELYTQLNKHVEAKEVFKKEVEKLNNEVANLKARKSKVIYRTKFDTLSTIDTVIVELTKCDSVVKVSDTIIGKQEQEIEGLVDALTESDNISVIQADIIKSKDVDLAESKKDLKKAKRKLFFTRVGGVVLIVGIIAVSLL